MSLLRVSLFGGIQIAHEGGPNVGTPTRAVQTLLAYLLLQRRRAHSRESLLGTFWGEHEEESARNCLNTTLWRLRRVLEPPGVPRGTYLITTPAGEVGFSDQSTYWLDVDVLERHASAVIDASEGTLTDSAVERLEEAVRLYAGDILDGVYDDWALRERERLRTVYLNSLGCLMRYRATHGAPERGIVHAEEILRHDPLREEIHRQLMRLHIATGARASAARQYDMCRRLLGEELGVEPMSETEALLVAIKRSTDSRGTDPASAPAGVNALTLELRGAAQSRDRAAAYLRDVVGRFEQALRFAPPRMKRNRVPRSSGETRGSWRPPSPNGAACRHVKRRASAGSSEIR